MCIYILNSGARDGSAGAAAALDAGRNSQKSVHCVILEILCTTKVTKHNSCRGVNFWRSTQVEILKRNIFMRFI